MLTILFGSPLEISSLVSMVKEDFLLALRSSIYHIYYFLRKSLENYCKWIGSFASAVQFRLLINYSNQLAFLKLSLLLAGDNKLQFMTNILGV